jgi:hypothetical protein
MERKTITFHARKGSLVLCLRLLSADRQTDWTLTDKLTERQRDRETERH